MRQRYRSLASRHVLNAKSALLTITPVLGFGDGGQRAEFEDAPPSLWGVRGRRGRPARCAMRPVPTVEGQSRGRGPFLSGRPGLSLHGERYVFGRGGDVRRRGGGGRGLRHGDALALVEPGTEGCYGRPLQSPKVRTELLAEYTTRKRRIARADRQKRDAERGSRAGRCTGKQLCTRQKSSVPSDSRFFPHCEPSS